MLIFIYLILINRFADETFSEEHKPTLLVEYRHRFIDTLRSRCKVQIWDCLASSSATIMSSIYKGAHGIILLYDVTSPSTLESTEDWLKEIKTYAKADVVVYLVGTKTDLDRNVSIESGKQMAEKLGIKYYEVSSKTGENVDSLFCKIVNDLKDVNMLSVARSSSSAPAHSRQDPSFLNSNDIRASSSADPKDEKGKCCCVIQ